MKTLTLDLIAPYLSHQLKVIRTIRPQTKQIFNISGYEQFSDYTNITLTNGEGKFWSSECLEKQIPSQFNIILRKMDLTIPIIIEGKEVIPLIELAKISYSTEWFYKEGTVNVVSAAECHGFEWNEDHFELYNQISGGFLPVKNQLQLFKWLYENKFDIEGLIEQNLAIDADSLQTNPYNS
jgi:hypothetical protein